MQSSALGVWSGCANGCLAGLGDARPPVMGHVVWSHRHRKIEVPTYHLMNQPEALTYSTRFTSGLGDMDQKHIYDIHSTQHVCGAGGININIIMTIDVRDTSPIHIVFHQWIVQYPIDLFQSVSFLGFNLHRGHANTGNRASFGSNSLCFNIEPWITGVKRWK